MHTLHLQNNVHEYMLYAHHAYSIEQLTSSGATTTAGWEAGAEWLSPEANLDAAERGRKAATEGLRPTGGLEAAAAYEMG